MKYYINKDKLEKEVLHPHTWENACTDQRILSDVANMILEVIEPDEPEDSQEKMGFWVQCGKVISQDLMGATTCANLKPCRTHENLNPSISMGLKPASECEHGHCNPELCLEVSKPASERWTTTAVPGPAAEELLKKMDQKPLRKYGGKWHYPSCNFPSVDQAVCNCPSNLKPASDCLQDDSVEQLIAENTRFKEALEKIVEYGKRPCPDDEAPNPYPYVFAQAALNPDKL